MFVSVLGRRTRMCSRVIAVRAFAFSSRSFPREPSPRNYTALFADVILFHRFRCRHAVHVFLLPLFPLPFLLLLFSTIKPIRRRHGSMTARLRSVVSCDRVRPPTVRCGSCETSPGSSRRSSPPEPPTPSAGDGRNYGS